MADSRTHEADLVVVGAGLAGLAAAREAVGAGASVVVVEARDRVGGRVLNEDIGGGKVVEVGGQWIGPTQDRLAALADELGVETFPTYGEGENVIEYAGSLRRYTGTIPRINPLVLLDVERAQRKLNRLARRVPLEAPWEAPDAAQARRPDRGHLDAPQPRHARRPRAARAGDRGGLGGAARGHLAAARALLHPLGGQPRDAVRHRGRRPAGPLRRRLAARAAADGRASSAPSGCVLGAAGARGSSTAPTA